MISTQDMYVYISNVKSTNRLGRLPIGLQIRVQLFCGRHYAQSTYDNNFRFSNINLLTPQLQSRRLCIRLLIGMRRYSLSSIGYETVQFNAHNIKRYSLSSTNFEPKREEKFKMKLILTLVGNFSQTMRILVNNFRQRSTGTIHSKLCYTCK